MPGCRGRVGLHIDLIVGRGLTLLVHQPMAIRRKHGPAHTRSWNRGEQRSFLVPKGKSPHCFRVALSLSEGKRLAIRRPGVRNVRDPLLGFGEALGGSGAVGTLTPNPQIPFAVRL